MTFFQTLCRPPGVRDSWWGDLSAASIWTHGLTVDKREIDVFTYVAAHTSLLTLMA